MVFSSVTFLFLFLPLVLGLYGVASHRGKNGVLLAASLLFYAWGAGQLVLVILWAITCNWLLGLCIDRFRRPNATRCLLALTIALNLAPLIYFKYASFLSHTLADLLAPWAIDAPRIGAMVLPIGISFFTFQAMSYVIDVHRRDAEVQRDPLQVALYISLFPQLIAGPIVRYRDVARQIGFRRTSAADFAEGIHRFVVGLAKKVLLANSLAPLADAVFNAPDATLSPAAAWLGVLAYALQIYFDFSGYSDMAIGLGRMFGFRFLENFNYPYVAQSVTEFWRRWHISLSTWFRDYVYVPLGGNRRGALRTYRNLMVVFLLCGFWHGASWNFIAWGAYYGAFLIGERWVLASLLQRAPRALRHVYTLLVVAVGWVFFQATSMAHAIDLLRTMSGFGSPHPANDVLPLVDPAMWFVLAAGCLGALPWLGAARNVLANPMTAESTAQWLPYGPAPGFTRVAALVLLLVASAIVLSAATYNPFIYYQF